MPSSPLEVLDREFLEARAKLLDLAAVMDRIDRAGGNVENDPRLPRLRQALEIIGGSEPDRAEQVQLLFSLPYDEQWRQKFLGPRP
jgi:hypothetical protein